MIVTADHGEELLDHGFVSHHTLSQLEDELIRIPLIVKLPNGAAAGTRVDRLVRMVDIAPTLLDVIGLDDQTAAMDGASIVPLLDGSDGEPRVAPILTKGFGIIRTDRWKYLLDWRDPTGERELLFDVGGDPLLHEEVTASRPLVTADSGTGWPSSASTSRIAVTPPLNSPMSPRTPPRCGNPKAARRPRLPHRRRPACVSRPVVLGECRAVVLRSMFDRRWRENRRSDFQWSIGLGVRNGLRRSAARAVAARRLGGVRIAVRAQPVMVWSRNRVVSFLDQKGMTHDGSPTERIPVYDTAEAVDPLDDEFRSVLRYRDFVLLWTKRNISLRYKRSLLGMLWTVLEPLAVISILAVVFSAVFRFEIDNYPVYILSGWVTWEFFARATSVMAGDIQATREITSRFRVPRSAFLVASVLSTLFNWALAMIVLSAVMAVMGHPFTWALVAVPFAMLLLAVFAFGVGCAVATLAALFHDFILMYMVLLTMWLYSTPIIYPLAIVPDAARPLLLLNPLTHLLVLIRAPVYEGRFPLPAEWMTGVVISLMSAIAGTWILTRSRAAMEYRG